MAAPDRPLAIYDKARSNAATMIQDAMRTADTTESVAKTIVGALSTRTPRHRYTSGKGDAAIAMLRRFAPEGVFDKGLRKQMRDRRSSQRAQSARGFCNPALIIKPCARRRSHQETAGNGDEAHVSNTAPATGSTCKSTSKISICGYDP